MVGFVVDGTSEYAGKHVLIDFYECANHRTQQEIEQVMIKACKDTGATVLYSYLHPFTGGGVSGAVILAESHMSIHTWPEKKFIALDIFVCGDCNPELAIKPLEDFFQPVRAEIKLCKRGIVDEHVSSQLTII